MKSNIFTHQLEFANAPLCIVVADSFRLGAALAEKHHKGKLQLPKEPAGGLMYDADEGFVVLLLYSQLDLPTIVHELTHVTISAFRRMGIKLSAKSEEAYCYHNDMLMRLFMEWAVTNELPFIPFTPYSSLRPKAVS